ncbi:MAG: hypothetical protein AB8F94_20045 [Saprospiraceae bacterium]
MKKITLLLAIIFIGLAEINAQGNEQNDLEHLYRNKPIYKVIRSTYFREYDISDSAIKAEIPKGSNVKVINSFFRGKWEILYQGETGWVNESDLRFHEAGGKNEFGASDSLYKNQPTYFVRNETFLKEHMSFESATLDIVPKGVKVVVINSLFNDWWEVLYDNRRGNLPKNMLSYNEISQIQEPSQTYNQPPIITHNPTYSEPKPEPSSNTSIDRIKYSKRVTKKTSLRKSSSSKSRVILRLEVGQKVSVIDDSEQWWAKVMYQEKIGWVKKSLLKD